MLCIPFLYIILTPDRRGVLCLLINYIMTLYTFFCVWLSGRVVGWDVGLAINRSRVRIPASPLLSGQVVNTCVPLSPSSIIWYQPMGCVAGKVTVGLASHWPCVTDISGSPPMGSRLRRGRWAPAYALLVSIVNFSFTFIPVLVLSSMLFYARHIVCSSTIGIVCLYGVLFRIMFLMAIFFFIFTVHICFLHLLWWHCIVWI